MEAGLIAFGIAIIALGVFCLYGFYIMIRWGIGFKHDYPYTLGYLITGALCIGIPLYFILESFK